MKKVLPTFALLFSLMSAASVKAQSFTTTTDTMSVTITSSNATTPIHNDIILPGATPVNIKWNVAATDFPADWLKASAFGICDATTCRYNVADTLLWRTATATTGDYFLCTYPGIGGSMVFDYTPNLTSAAGVTSNGCHYLTVYLSEDVPLGTSKMITFIICKGATSTPMIKSSNEENVMLYPNPANGEVNVVYDANADVKSVAIYNIIGKMMNVYKVAGNSANLNIENVPAGIYFLKLYNSKGNVVVTRKFTKQ